MPGKGVQHVKVGEGTRIWHREKSVFGNCEIGSNCVIHAPVWIGDGVNIGDYTKVQAFAFIPTGVTIGWKCFIGPHVCFTNDKYPPSNGKAWEPTIVKDRVSIGAGAIILPGVTIWEDAVIGAGAVVTKDVPDHAIVYGNPAHEKYQGVLGAPFEP